MKTRGVKKKLNEARQVSINLDIESVDKSKLVCKPNLSEWIRVKISEAYAELPMFKNQADIFGAKK